MVSDGDSKSFHRVSQEMQYGDVAIEKLDCVGHVGKRMGTRLRELKRCWGKDKLSDGKTVGGRGRLTDAKIDNLQTYYRLAILRNLHNVNAMEKEIMAGLYHSCHSDDPNEQHRFCPIGDSSWCRWKRDQDSEHVSKNSLPAVFVPVLKPIYMYEALSKKDLLVRGSDGFTQNANESFNSVLWQRCPKHRFHVRSAMASAVIQYNEGASAALGVLQQMNLPISVHALHSAVKHDQKRIASADQKTSIVAKRKRESDRVEKKRLEEGYMEQEGTIYSSGAF